LIARFAREDRCLPRSLADEKRVCSFPQLAAGAGARFARRFGFVRPEQRRARSWARAMIGS
jgi:hypothetical protein